MLPKQAHDFVLQTLGDEVKDKEVVERARTCVANKVAMAAGSGLAPMDVWWGGGQWEWDRGEDGKRRISGQCR